MIALRTRTLALASLAGALLVGITGCDGDQTDAEQVERAKTYLDEGDRSAGVITLKNALRQNPDNAEARWLLGKAYVGAGDGRAAEKELRRAMALGASAERVAIPLAKALYLQGEHQRLLDTLPVKAHMPAGLRAALHAIRGHVLLGRGDLEGAASELDAALAADPDHAPAMVGKGELALANRDLDAAFEWATKATGANGDSHQAWAFKGRVEELMDERDQAEVSYSEAIRLSTYPTAYMYRRALNRIELDDFGGARQDAASVRSRAPGAAAGPYIEGLIHFRQGQYQAAQSALEEALNRQTPFENAEFFLGAAHLAQGHREQAESYLSRFLDRRPRANRAMTMLAEIRMHRGDLAGAERLLRRALEVSPNDPKAAALLAEARLAREGLDPGAEPLQSAAGTSGLPASARTMLGEGLMRQGRTGEGMAELQAAFENDPKAHRAGQLLFAAHLQAGELDQAVAVAETMLERLPDHPMPRNLLGVAYLAKGELDRAEEALRDALELAPGYANAAMNLARLELAGGELDAARGWYRHVLEHDEGNHRAMLGMASLAGRAGRTDDALRWLRQAHQGDPNSLEAGLALANLSGRLGNVAEALAIARRLVEAHPNEPRVVRTHADALLANGQPAEAAVSYRRVIELGSPTGEDWLRLAAAQARAGDRAGMRASLDQGLTQHPDSPILLGAMARMSLHDGHHAAVLELQRRIQAGDPGAPEGPMRGDGGEGDTAASALARAYEGIPASELAVAVADGPWTSADSAFATGGSGLARMVDEAGGAGAVAASGEGLATPDRPDPSASAAGDEKARVSALLRRGSLAEAEALARELVSGLPKDAEAWNLLGAALLASDDHPAAEDAFEQAQRLMPGEPRSAYNLAQILASRGDSAGARRLYRTVLDAHPGHVPALLRLARLEAATGDMAAANDRLQEATSSKPGDPRPRLQLAVHFLRLGLAEEARDMAHAVAEVHGDEPAVLGVVGEARRRAGDADGAIRVFRRLVELRPGLAEAWYRLGLAYAARPGADGDAQRALEAALERAPDHVGAGLGLFRLYRHRGLAERADALLKSLQARHPDHPAIAAELRRAALRAVADRRVAESGSTAKPGDASEAVDLAAALWVSGKRDAAIRLLERHGAGDGSDPLIQRNLGPYYLAEGRVADARGAYEAVLDAEPDNVNALNNLAQILAAGDAARARVLAERALELRPGSPDIKDTLGVILLRGDRPRDALPLLADAAQNAPGDPAIGFHLAQALERTGSPGRAREVLYQVLSSGAVFAERQEAHGLMRRLIR